MGDHYANIRDVDQLGGIIGTRVVDITQHDEEEFAETKQSCIHLHFDNGTTLTFYIDDKGFDVNTVGD